MKKLQKIFIATAAVATIVAPTVASASIEFKDVKSTDYYAKPVQSLVERGIIKGYTEDQTFRPNKEVTRGQAAKMIAGALGYDTVNVQDPQFKDVSVSNDFYGAIAALAERGIINGYQETGTFEPNEPMTRHQMAKVISLAFELQANNIEIPFTDVTKGYESYVTALYANNITTGKTATIFEGKAKVTRGQLAAFISRAENVMKTPTPTATEFSDEIAKNTDSSNVEEIISNSNEVENNISTVTNANTSKDSISEEGSSNSSTTTPPSTGETTTYTEMQKKLFHEKTFALAAEGYLTLTGNKVLFRNKVSFTIPETAPAETIPGFREEIMKAMTEENRKVGNDAIFQQHEDLNKLAQARIEQYFELIDEYGYDKARDTMHSHMFGYYPSPGVQMALYNNDFSGAEEIFVQVGDYFKLGGDAAFQAKDVIRSFTTSELHALMFWGPTRKSQLIGDTHYGVGYALNSKGSYSVMIISASENSLDQLGSFVRGMDPK